MIIKEEFIKKIRQVFDLNIYEVKIWTALLSRGISTAAELSDISSVPRSRSYDVLESLEKKGFVIMKLGKPIKYIVVKPEEVIQRVKKTITKRSEEKLRLLEKARNTELFGELELLHKQGVVLVDPSDISGAVKGRENIYNHIETMLRNAKKSVTIVTSDTGLIRKNTALKHILKKLKKSNVKIKVAAPINNGVKEAREAANSLSEVAEVKNIKDINARFIIVDSKNVLFMVLEDKNVHSTYDVGVWVETPFFATALENMFELTWNNIK